MTHQEHQDQRFIRGIAKGDIKILEEIYAKYSDPIVKLVRQHKGTKDDARDVIQEALTIIYLKTKKTDIQLTSKFLTYFFAICRNIWLKMLRAADVDNNLEHNSEYLQFFSHFKMKCCWCIFEKELIPGKRFCKACDEQGRECRYCHRPMPEQFYKWHHTRCNSCFKKSEKQKAKQRFGL